MKEQSLNGRKSYDQRLGKCKYLVAYELNWWQKILFDGSHKTKAFDTQKEAEAYIESLFLKGIKSVHYFEKLFSTNYPIN